MIGLHDAGHLVQEILLEEQNGRHRHADGVKFLSGFRQFRDAAANLFQGVVADGANLSGVLRDGQELAGADETDSLDEYAHVKVRSGKAAGIQIVGGAVAHLDLVVFKSGLQIERDGLLAHELCVQHAVVDRQLVGTGLRGAGYRKIQAL